MAFRTSRRSFLTAASLSLATPAITGVPALGDYDRSPSETRRDFETLVNLFLETPRDRCAAVLADELRGGLSYRQALAGLFHAAVRHQGTHEIAMMFSAHRISGDMPVKENLLPLFWAFDSLARRIASVQPKEPVVR